ncbi:MAG TPA: right-handed parallel beta-helix repeat-containing protein [Pyrinomonadaceae bacterium]|nr:right-handed parallel beta-helix repeat-containing protein [Pyrinomonadaceae bacterium]
MTVAAAPGVNAAIVASGQTYAVFFVGTTSTDAVTLRNLEFKGVGDPINLIGILNSSAGTLTVEGCTFSGLDNALTMEQVAGNLFVHDSVFRNNLFGIGLFGPTGEGVLTATIDHCKLEQNDTGVSVSSKVVAVIRDTIAANNTSRGIQVRSTGTNQRAEALVVNCQLSHNSVGLNASGTNGFAVVRLSRSAITNNALTGVNVGPNGTVYSFKDNVIAGNTTDVNGTLSPLQAK